MLVMDETVRGVTESELKVVMVSTADTPCTKPHVARILGMWRDCGKGLARYLDRSSEDDGVS